MTNLPIIIREIFPRRSNTAVATVQSDRSPSGLTQHRREMKPRECSFYSVLMCSINLDSQLRLNLSWIWWPTVNWRA